MIGRVAEIWRHPIKSHGREQLHSASLLQGHAIPHDRKWAVAHDAAKLSSPLDWVPCGNFSRGSKAPKLQAITASLDEAEMKITLSHPEREDLTFCPDEPADAAKFISWVQDISPKNRALPSNIVAGHCAMTDTDYPSVSLINLASNKEVAGKLGQDISPLRWRGNLLLDGLSAWEERDWIGKTLKIGDAELEVKENIVRCMATTANTTTGERDADTLGALKQHWGHQEFGVYAVVTKAGTITQDMAIEVLS